MSGDLHGRPTAEELLDAVHGFLRDDLMPSLEDPLRHQVRIAARVVEIAARELELGPAQEAAHRARLEDLGVANDHALCEAIRRGDFDGSAELKKALTADAIDRLAVANPAWLSPREGPPGVPRPPRGPVT
ncbi:MAG: DUF6285 domain-containing protein [Acidimicrobiales bacterium]